MRIVFLSLLSCCLCLCSVAWAELDGETAKAKTAYEETVAKQKDLLKAAFERKLADVGRDGDLERVSKLQEELDLFLTQGDLPESTEVKAFGQKYSKAVEVARTRLKSTIERRVKALTRSGMIDEAKEAQAALDTLLESSPPMTNDEPGDDSLKVVSAIWKHDGQMGNKGTQEFNAQPLISQVLLKQGKFFANPSTLGVLDGRNSSASLFMELLIFKQAFYLQLTEGSGIAFENASPEDQLREGTQIGDTPMHLLSVSSESSRSRVFVTKQVVPRLLSGAVKIEAAMFPRNDPELRTRGVFRIRSGKQILEIYAAEGSHVVIPMSSAVDYQPPWEGPGKALDLQLIVAQGVWKHDGRHGRIAKETVNIAALVEKKLNAGEVVEFSKSTFGSLNKSDSTVSGFLTILLNGVSLDLQLTEGSTMQIEDLQEADLKNPGISLQNSVAMLLGITYSTTDRKMSNSTPEMVNEFLRRPILIAPPLFSDFAFKKPKMAIVRFRVAQKVLRIEAHESSALSLKH